MLACLLSLSLETSAQAYSDIDTAAERVEQKVIEWRRQIHQHPELSNREVKPPR